MASRSTRATPRPCGACGRTLQIRARGLCQTCDYRTRISPCCRCHKNKQIVARGMCKGCYRRDRLQRNPECCIEGCANKSLSRGWCEKHYDRWANHGDPCKLKIAERGAGYVRPDGYRWISVGGNRQEAEHRVVMERLLGRRLVRGETVHHINGDRADNRPENLELWSTTQPYGQRVKDKVAWAKELLAFYEPSALSADIRDRDDTEARKYWIAGHVRGAGDGEAAQKDYVLRPGGAER